LVSEGKSTAGTPIGAIGSGHQSLVDEIATEGGMIGMEELETTVHLALGIAQTGLELLDDPLENDEALGA
jgi:hypothetical protein